MFRTWVPKFWMLKISPSLGTHHCGAGAACVNPNHAVDVELYASSEAMFRRWDEVKAKHPSVSIEGGACEVYQ